MSPMIDAVFPAKLTIIYVFFCGAVVLPTVHLSEVKHFGGVEAYISIWTGIKGVLHFLFELKRHNRSVQSNLSIVVS